jgi:uncharacterized protein YcaQ
VTAQPLSREEARRMALAAQGLSSPPRDRTAGWGAMAAAIDRLRLLQIDSVNVLARAHYLPLYSRLGPYDRNLLDARAFGAGRKGRALFEYWAHEASLLPVATWPLMQWRMQRAAKGEGLYQSLARFRRENRRYVEDVRQEIAARGPVSARDLAGEGKRTGPWWGWHEAKLALEWLFWAGQVTASGRRGNFERLYDVPERVIPATALAAPVPDEAEAIRTLVAMSAEALGIASDAELRDYFRLPVAQTKRAIAELTEAGILEAVRVEGWPGLAWRHRDARLPRTVAGTALLSPFDPVVWHRTRAERVHGLRYRIEIYTPAHKREFGYYVLPFIHRGRFAARSCLKADRARSALVVNTAHREPDAAEGATAEALALELIRLAGWLGLSRVEVKPRGDLAKGLKQAVSTARLASD